MTSTTERLIINSPYEKPRLHLKYNREIRKFELVEGRRSAGYIVCRLLLGTKDDPGIFIPLEMVNRIRDSVDRWREAGYRWKDAEITGITRQLLEYWKDPQRETKLFFCQIEAMETLVWLVESPEIERQGIELTGDGSPFQRLCSKMATGSGKTIVMAMLNAWQIINKATYPNDPRFSNSIFVVAPGITVKNRLKVLYPSDPENYYQAFDLVPPDMFDKLRGGMVKVI